MVKNITTILIVSDDASKKNDMALRLRFLGVKTETCSAGFHAIHLLERESFDIVVIFNDLTDMSGVEVIAITRTFKRQNELPIIYLYDKKHEDSGPKALYMGANMTFEEDNLAEVMGAITKLVKT